VRNPQTITLDEYNDLVGGNKGRSKYNSKKIIIDGIRFDSRKEGNRYCDLKSLRRAGDVSHFLMQVPFLLDGGVIYKLDFLVFWTDGRITYEDVKGFKTQVYKIKKKMVEARYPIKIIEL